MTTDLQQQPVVHITTFGYLHDAAPPATLTYDLRAHFRDPHVRPELRALTAHDAVVREAVLATPGVADLVEAAVAAVVACLSGPGTGPVSVAAGCAGGRHRAATFGIQLSQVLDWLGITSTLTHRDLQKDVVNR